MPADRRRRRRKRLSETNKSVITVVSVLSFIALMFGGYAVYKCMKGGSRTTAPARVEGTSTELTGV